MTEKLDREALIEKAAKAVLDNFHAPDDRHPSWWLNPKTVAEAVLAVFEEAHTPTDDEREALIGLRLASYPKRMSDGHLSVVVRANEEAADVVLAAGFRRPASLEPTRHD